MTARTCVSKAQKNKQKKKHAYNCLYMCFGAWGASERMAGGHRWLKRVGWGRRWPKQAARGLKHVSGGLQRVSAGRNGLLGCKEEQRIKKKKKGVENVLLVVKTCGWGR
jgi:hypothetical protein